MMHLNERARDAWMEPDLRLSVLVVLPVLEVPSAPWSAPEALRSDE